VADTRPYVDQFIKAVKVAPHLEDYLGGEAESEDTSDLAD
jgi:hypothetical protein